MILRELLPEEAGAAFRVQSAAFEFKGDAAAQKPLTRPSLGAFEDDGHTLMAMLTPIPYQANYCGHTLPAVGVAGVASLPQYRRRGAVRALFEELEIRAEQNGQVLGLLYPFSYAYYRKFGYERILTRLSLRIPTTALDCVPRSGDGVLYDGSQAAALLDIYRRYAAGRNLSFTRSDPARHWAAEPCKDGVYTYLWKNPQGLFDACAMISYKDDELRVRELLYASPEALRGMLGVLRLFEGQKKYIHFHSLPADSPVEPLLGRYRECEIKYISGVQGRIYDLGGLLAANAWPREPGAFTLRVEDSLERNRGVWAVEYENGAAEIRHTGEGDAGLTLTAPAAARLLLSGMGCLPEELPYFPGVAADDERAAADFCRAFPRRQTDLLDHF